MPSPSPEWLDRYFNETVPQHIGDVLGRHALGDPTVTGDELDEAVISEKLMVAKTLDELFDALGN